MLEEGDRSGAGARRLDGVWKMAKGRKGREVMRRGFASLPLSWLFLSSSSSELFFAVQALELSELFFAVQA
jgi:hypothetical protein